MDPSSGFNLAVRILELSASLPDFQGGEREKLRLNQSPVVNDLVNHDNIMNPP